MRQRNSLAARSDRPSLAVMPFMSIGGDEALGLGIATQIVNELARNKDLRLLARDSSFALASQNLMAQEIGQKLGARYLVEGTAERIDDALLVDVQLVDALEGSIAWGKRFSVVAAHAPRVQREIAITIAGSLRAGMIEVEKHAILGAGPRDLDVYELTLRGIARKHQFNPESARAGRADLEEAIRRDPNYAPAWAYLAWINMIDTLLQFTGEWTFARLGEVIGQFNRAIELDPNLPAPYQGLSQALIYTDDIDAIPGHGPPRRRTRTERCRRAAVPGQCLVRVRRNCRGPRLRPREPWSSIRCRRPFTICTAPWSFGVTSAIRSLWTKRSNASARRRISLAPTPIERWPWSASGALMRPKPRSNNAWPDRAES